jgi:CheY-like chemotaxis protein
MIRVVEDRVARILLVEDNPGDVVLTREALAAAQVPHELHVARDGVEALAFLQHRHPHTGAPRPDLILLDLNLPRVDGWELLGVLKADAALATIPVVVLTSSEMEEDIARGYRLHASSYIVKPINPDDLMRTARDLARYWFATVRLCRS